MLSAIINACKSFFHQIKETIKNFTKPETAVLAAGIVSCQRQLEIPTIFQKNITTIT